MLDKAIALRNVEYLNELLSRETDENRQQYSYACLRTQNNN